LNLDIRKLQRAIVDGLEDVKAQHIAVFNTEHLSSMFERVIVASGTSNRQTKALAASVRDSVKKRGLPVLSTEGEDNGEWIIVDCGAAVAHIMQPGVREYYRLEEIWGDKPVRMKTGDAPRGLVKASEAHDEPAPAPKKLGARAVKAGQEATAPKRAAKKLAQPVAQKAAKTASKPARQAASKTAAQATPERKLVARTRAAAPAQAPARKAAAPGRKAIGAGARSATTPGTKLVTKAGTKTSAKAVAKPATAPRSSAKPASAKKAPAKKAPSRR